MYSSDMYKLSIFNIYTLHFGILHENMSVHIEHPLRNSVLEIWNSSRTVLEHQEQF